MISPTTRLPASDAASKAKGKPDAKFMAGGQTLIPTMKQRLAKPSDVIDLGGAADLKGISASGGTVTIIMRVIMLLLLTHPSLC